MRTYCITKNELYGIELHREEHSINSSISRWIVDILCTDGQHRLSLFQVDAKILSGFASSYLSPESNKSSIVYHWAYTYIYFRIHIGFRPALFLDRDSHWRERKKKGLIIFLQNTESLTDEKRSKRGWPIRVKKIEWRERFNRTDSITRMMSIGREARAIMMLAGRFIKHAIARYLEWLISGYRLSSFMLLIKIV